MATFRTALGKTVDMAALQTRNERVRAVGNMGVNARGDTIDAFGNVVKPMTEKVNEKYSKTVGNRSAQPRKPAPQAQRATPPAPAPKVDFSELNEIERELEESADDDIEVEQIKAAEIKALETKKAKK
jgi:hypothetical protein